MKVYLVWWYEEGYDMELDRPYEDKQLIGVYKTRDSARIIVDGLIDRAKKLVEIPDIEKSEYSEDYYWIFDEKEYSEAPEISIYITTEEVLE